MWAALVLLAIAATPAVAQVTPVSIDSAVSVNQFGGQHAAEQPDIVIDVTATVRLGKGWVAYARPWFRRASSDPHAVAKEIYQAALQHQRSGPISTRIDLGYILSPIGLGMLDMRPDTNPTIMPHLSYLVPMPSFDPGVPSALPIASSYPLGAQFTASTTRWDARAAVVSSPPNRAFVLNAATPNPRSRLTVVVGGGITPQTGPGQLNVPPLYSQRRAQTSDAPACRVASPQRTQRTPRHFRKNSVVSLVSMVVNRS